MPFWWSVGYGSGKSFVEWAADAQCCSAFANPLAPAKKRSYLGIKLVMSLSVSRDANRLNESLASAGR